MTISNQGRPRSILIYGASGDTKTSQLYHAAKYLIKKHKKKIRLISADGGGYAPFVDPCPDPFFGGKSLVESGWVDIFDISYRERALADVRRLSEGYWPRDTKKGGVKSYFKSDDDCKTTKEEYAGLIAYMIEGISSISALWLNHIAEQNEGPGFKYSFQFQEDEYNIAGLQEGHYGIVQQQVRKVIIHGFNHLPIPYHFWTALVSKGTDKRTDETIYGPKSAGAATTYEIPSWFMDCLHVAEERIEVENSIQLKKVLWFQKHNDRDTGIMYLAKPRIMPESMPQLLKLYPNGYVPLGFKSGLDRYFRAIEKIQNEAAGIGKGAVAANNSDSSSSSSNNDNQVNEEGKE